MLKYTRVVKVCLDTSLTLLSLSFPVEPVEAASRSPEVCVMSPTL